MIELVVEITELVMPSLWSATLFLSRVPLKPQVSAGALAAKVKIAVPRKMPHKHTRTKGQDVES